ncbi:alpha/beta fold hydrolase [Streptomyces coffeae]|uniref:Alpha/beta fold hydrolase n=1 Tax=Streptomyces coffeae TaxID=621382 RepID=A0ABS1N655_9ACTN|nr:alpha/beta fold hydrolase [Streptomyces coffeae]MBL1095528.1 alpha/beta fold hydrolase [Streptomyces coffeae]
MAQQALPERGARLGRPMGSAATRRTVHGVVLLLPGGEPVGTRRPSRMSAASVLPLARRLVRAGQDEGLAAHVVHYRRRGWNGSAADPAADAEWAADEVGRLYGDVPVCLTGHGMGGRAALRAAGHPAVSTVVALAPWLPEPDATLAPDPVKQLVGRQVLIAHGTNDERTDPDLSYRLAERAKKVNRNVCRFEVHTDGHGLHQHRSEVRALTSDFLLGSLFATGYSRPVADALAAPPPLGLRMPLAVGFGSTLRQ